MTPSALLRYGSATLAVALVVELKLLVDPLIAQQSPFLLLAAAVIVGAWFGGVGPGLLATALGAAAADYFFLSPFASFGPLGVSFLPIFLFVLQGGLITLLVEALRRARERAETRTLDAQRGQEELRGSEERFRLLVEGLSDYAIFMLDPEGRVTTWNEGAQRTMGYEATEVIGEHFSVFYTEEDVERGHPQEELREAEEEGSYEEEGLRVCKDGSRFWASVLITPLRDEEGNLRGFSKVTRNITERKRAEEALKASETRYRTLVEQTPAITYVQEPLESTNPKAVTYVSPQYETILGYPADSEVIDEEHWLRTIHPEDRERVLAEEARTDESGEPFKVEYRVIARDGRVVWVRDEATLVRDEDGEPLYWLGVQYDITERKRAEEALTASEIRYRTLVEHLPAITYIEAVDREERRTDLLYVSPQIEAMFGYSPEEWMADPHLFEKLLHPEDRERVLDEDARTDETGEPFSVEYRQFTRDGRIIWVSDEAVLVKDEEGKPLFWQGVMHDVTDHKRTEEALRQSEELYRSVVEQAAESIFLVDIETRRILEANAAFFRSLGYSTGEVKDMTLYDVVAHDRETIDQNIERIAAEGRYFVGERRYRRRDGTPLDVEVSVSIVPYGGREVMCVVAHDVTGRKHAEENLRQSLSAVLALREAGQVLGSTLESGEIVSRLLEIMRSVSNLTAVVISLQDEVGDVPIWRSVGLEGLWRRARFAPEAEAARQAALEDGERRLFRLQHPQLEAEHLMGLCLPLRSKERVFGVLEAYGQESLLESATVDTLSSLASQAGSALENALLYEQLEEREQMLQDLVAKLLRAQEEERRRVAYEVHDGLAQVAAAAHQHLQAFAERFSPDAEKGRRDLDRILRLVRATVTDARRVIANLRPTSLDDLGLAAALSLEVESLREEGYHVDYEEKLGDERLPAAAEISLFRVAQEALNNVRKHAQTRQVSVELHRREDEVLLKVLDHGRGFDPAAPSVESGPGARVGLAGMRERINMLGGSLEIRSQPGAGTSVVATIDVTQVPQVPLA